MLHCKVAFASVSVKIQSYFFHRFLNTTVCDWGEKKGLTYSITQHFMHFEVEGMYNFKSGECTRCTSQTPNNYLRSIIAVVLATGHSLVLTFKWQLGFSVTKGNLGVL